MRAPTSFLRGVCAMFLTALGALAATACGSGDSSDTPGAGGAGGSGAGGKGGLGGSAGSAGKPVDVGGCKPKTCADLGVECGPAGDGCNGTLECGKCAEGLTCGGPDAFSKCVTPGKGDCVPKTCADQGIECGPAGDGCGKILQCGTCKDGEQCGSDEVYAKCVPADGTGGQCTPKTCADYEAEGVDCGQQGDGCGKTIDCGSCKAGETCGGGGPSKCGTGGGACDAKTCADYEADGIDCGQQSDSCGKLIDCGGCASGQKCGGGGPSKCGTGTCKPLTCAGLKLNCGKVADGCGSVIDCGSTCPTGQVCGGAGKPNVCGVPSACVPKTTCPDGMDCGSIADGCGGVVECGGPCKAPAICGGGGKPNVCGGGGGGTCVPKTCAQLGKNCGPVADGCGHLIDCGTCKAPAVCGGGGVASVCGGATACVPKTCTQLKKNCGPVADGCGSLVQCGDCAAGAVCGGGGVPNVCSGTGPGGGPCTNLCTKQVDCPGSGTTSVSGVVYAPNGTLPIYDALVYVPNAAVQPFPTTGVTCDNCSAEASGSPLVSTKTNYKGQFTLNDMPVGAKIPLVIQIGRWRRQITIDNVPKCVNTPLPASLTRLPKNKTEGDIPKMAITTGGADALQCLIRKIGVDDSEFTQPSGTGRINLYAGYNGTNRYVDGYNGYTGAARDMPSETTLWGSVAAMKKYDAMLLTCEGNGDRAQQQAPYRANIKSYADVGGRIFASHWHHSWMELGPAPWPTVATFLHEEDLDKPSIVADINTAFPKGSALAQWLLNAGSSQPLGKVKINDAQHTVQAVNAATSTRWIYIDKPIEDDGDSTTASVQYFTANTPVGTAPDKQCGRLVMSDLHVSGNNDVNDDFPDGCNNTALSDQEKVLAFMLFDLTACIQADVPPKCTPKTCKEEKIGCGLAGDGCGGTLKCGDCPSGQTCGGGGVPSQCGGASCTPKTCAAQKATCGTVPDGCGGTVPCGNCPAGQTCGGGGVPNQCGAPKCTPLTCAQLKLSCGQTGDGCGKTINCGDCKAPETCGGGGVPGQCGTGGSCSPTSCAAEKVTCGPIANGCGKLLDCGDCKAPETCGGGGVPGQCGTGTSCTPRTCQDLGAVCGQVSDGCGGLTKTCGDCKTSEVCSNGACVTACDPRTCQEAGAECGPVADGCGDLLDCGTCPAGQTCGGGGVANKCGAPDIG